MNDLDTLADVFRGLKPWRGVVPAGHRANFLGVMTALAYFHEVELRDFDYLERARAGDYDTVTRASEVGDGERYFEWVNTVEAARLAQDRFVLVEAGGGFGARSVDAHAALQMLNPLPETYVVVEAVPQHMEWARQHFAANGLDPAQHWFINALINDTGRPELFAHAPGVYFSNIIDTATRQRVFDAAESEGVLDAVLRNLMVEGRVGLTLPVEGEDDTTMEVDFISALRLETILAPLPTVDLLDLDIQLAEERVVPDAIAMIERKVRRLHIGTHQPPIHDNLVELLRERGWRLVFCYAPYSKFDTPLGRFATGDGILTALNPGESLD